LFGYASDGASAFRLRAASRPSGLLGFASPAALGVLRVPGALFTRAYSVFLHL
jgi:hypothetical protein